VSEAKPVESVLLARYNNLHYINLYWLTDFLHATAMPSAT